MIFLKKCSSVVHCQRVAIFSEIEFKCEKDSREDDDDMQDFSSAECRIHRRNSDDKRRRKREKIVGRRENAKRAKGGQRNGKVGKKEITEKSIIDPIAAVSGEN